MPTAPRKPDPPWRVIRSDEVFEGDRQLLIEHHGEQYGLRIDENDKLILDTTPDKPRDVVRMVVISVLIALGCIVLLMLCGLFLATAP